MKTLKITLALVAVLLLTVSGVKSENVVNDSDPTYKSYDNNNPIAHRRDKAKIKSHG